MTSRKTDLDSLKRSYNSMEGLEKQAIQLCTKLSKLKTETLYGILGAFGGTALGELLQTEIPGLQHSHIILLLAPFFSVASIICARKGKERPIDPQLAVVDELDRLVQERCKAVEEYITRNRITGNELKHCQNFMRSLMLADNQTRAAFFMVGPKQEHNEQVSILRNFQLEHSSPHIHGMITGDTKPSELPPPAK